MGPKNQYTAHARDFDESDLDKTEEYLNFIETLRQLHIKRGNPQWNPEPDIQRKKVDLLKLYKKIVDAGGYTIVSQATGLWKEIAVQFNPPAHNSNIGFVLKTLYLKCLGAYEIEDHWGKEAPPREVLEEGGAAGSELLDRKAPEVAPSPGLITRGRSGTGDSPAPGLTTTPSGRTLREAPTKRQLFQPEVATPKPRTPATNIINSGTPQGQFSINNNGSKPTSMNLSGGAAVAPQPPMFAGQQPQLELPRMREQVLSTPYTDPQHPQFQRKSISSKSKNFGRDRNNLPLGHGHIGPGPLERAYLSLLSEIDENVEYGLNIWIKGSLNENIPLEPYPDLPATLLKLVQDLISSTSSSSVVRYMQIQLETGDWKKASIQAAYGLMILRNLLLIPGNVQFVLDYASESVPILLQVLELPQTSALVEHKAYAIDILETVAIDIDLSRYPSIDVIGSLWKLVLSNDRFMIINGLRTITKLSVKDSTGQINNCPADVKEHINALLLLRDEELVAASLDFLYKFTGDAANAVSYLDEPTSNGNLEQLVRLLDYNVTVSNIEPQQPVEEIKKKPRHIPTILPELPQDLVNDIVMQKEPERARAWMRSEFEQVEESEITQIAIWQAYQTAFQPFIVAGPNPQPQLAAPDFIKNVNVAFKGAHPMVVPPRNGQAQRFIIKGIAPREVPVGIDGKPYHACKWEILKSTPDQSGKPSEKLSELPCNKFFKKPNDLLGHLIKDHSTLPATGESSADKTTELKCKWKGCKKGIFTDKKKFLDHIYMHIPVTQDELLPKSINGKKLEEGWKVSSSEESKAPKADRTWITHTSNVNEKGEPVGVPYMAALVLRNLSLVDSDDTADRFVQFKDHMFNIFSADKHLRPILLTIFNNLFSVDDELKGQSMLVD